MSDLEIQTALRDHYKNVIEIAEKTNQEQIKDVIAMYEVDLCVCNCASEVFKVDIYQKAWVLEIGTILGDYPIYFNTKEKIIEMLKIRLKILNEIIITGR